MSGEVAILTAAELAAAGGSGYDGSFRSSLRAMLAQQAASWPMLREALRGLQDVRSRDFDIGRTRIRVQYNPSRIISTTAKVDAATIGRRPCFLCSENLPPEERGIVFGEDYLILCNPYPVLPDHLVISTRAHIPQAIGDSLLEFLDLTKQLGGEWFTLYNGPRCGASAPDHLHFQACSAGAISLFNEIDRLESHLVIESTVGIVRAIYGYYVDLMVFEAGDPEWLAQSILSALEMLAQLTGCAGEEPLINLVATCTGDGWRVVVIPRGRHRPSCFFAEGEARLTVSPAAIDLSGVMVVPQREHFDRIGVNDLETICNEVRLGNELFSRWFGMLVIGGGDE